MMKPQVAYTDNGEPPIQRSLVVLQLARQLYALPVESILQILPMVTIAPLPQSDRAIKGVINVRGVTVPVVDTRYHLGLATRRPTLHTPIVLLQIRQQPVGLIVDEVHDVLNLPANHIVPTGDLLPEELHVAPLLMGLVRVPQTIIFVLDPEHLFLPEQIEALTEAKEFLLKVASEENLETLPATTWSQAVIEEVVHTKAVEETAREDET